MSRRKRLKLWIRQMCDGNGTSYRVVMDNRAAVLGLADARYLTDGDLDALFVDIVAGVCHA